MCYVLKGFSIPMLSIVEKDWEGVFLMRRKKRKFVFACTLHVTHVTIILLAKSPMTSQMPIQSNESYK